MVKLVTYKIRLLAVVLALLINSCYITNQAYAGTKNMVLPGFADLTYPDSIKLKKKGCQEIKFSYVIDENLSLVNTAFIIQLVHKTKKIMYGYGYWFSDVSTSDGLPSMSRIGAIPMKICRNNWEVKSKNEITKYVGVKPGLYDLYFAFGSYGEGVVSDKKVILDSIRITN